MAPLGARQTSGEKLEITAFAVNMSNIGPGLQCSGRDQHRPVVDGGGARKPDHHDGQKKENELLLKALQKMPSHGRFSIPGLVGPDPHQLRLGNPLRYAWQTAQPEGGRRIVIATDRYIGFAEARDQQQTIDYPSRCSRSACGQAGESQGKRAVATKISFDKKKNAIELENYSSEPVRLNNVKVKVKT